MSRDWPALISWSMPLSPSTKLLSRWTHRCVWQVTLLALVEPITQYFSMFSWLGAVPCSLLLHQLIRGTTRYARKRMALSRGRSVDGSFKRARQPHSLKLHIKKKSPSGRGSEAGSVEEASVAASVAASARLSEAWREASAPGSSAAGGAAAGVAEVALHANGPAPASAAEAVDIAAHDDEKNLREQLGGGRASERRRSSLSRLTSANIKSPSLDQMQSLAERQMQSRSVRCNLAERQMHQMQSLAERQLDAFVSSKPPAAPSGARLSGVMTRASFGQEGAAIKPAVSSFLVPVPERSPSVRKGRAVSDEFDAFAFDVTPAKADRRGSVQTKTREVAEARGRAVLASRGIQSDRKAGPLPHDGPHMDTGDGKHSQRAGQASPRLAAAQPGDEPIAEPAEPEPEPPLTFIL